ncbi:hypothetical protein F3J16_02600 [Burkholderia sp. Ap-962]|uniref:hypothetical protein n=1 Tax=Burkholderia sp. Ap-962 TaxID=2608333 RepID=UPI00141ED520|nr:hypothetical protein [Burkholderia sp. Ap-962]NIF69084.1 hypothetical protein [Burkholderia sp. Ap-962]
MIQYIAEAQGLWYEGSSSWLRRIQGCLIILSLSVDCGVPSRDLLFHEDYFNSATRIRRGRLFEKDQRNSWTASCVSRFPNFDLNNATNLFNVNRAYRTADIKIKPGAEVALGDFGSISHWLVVLSEHIVDGYFLTLKSKTLFGVLPEPVTDVIPEANRSDVLTSLNAVVAAAGGQAPQSVIDACRNAACHVISAMFPASNPSGEYDLGKLVTFLLNSNKGALADAGDLINKLHSRAKANAAAARGTRPVSSRDAELAISSLAFLLQDAGWAVHE